MSNDRVLTFAGVRRELIKLIQKQKLRYFGNLIRHDSLQRDLLEEMVEEKKGRGCPITHWSKNVEGWLETKFFECKRKAESRKDYTMIVDLRDGEDA